MGVLECDRMDCESIMCSRYSDTYGYLCGKCFDELVKLGVKTDIDEFLLTPPKIKIDESDSYNYFNTIFSDD